jgi:hypothetical protein
MTWIANPLPSPERSSSASFVVTENASGTTSIVESAAGVDAASTLWA